MGRNKSKKRMHYSFKIPEYTQYLILTITMVVLFLLGFIAGYFSSGFTNVKYILSYVSFFCYTLGSISFILWVIIKFMIVHTFWDGYGNNTKVTILLAIPIFGIIWHYFVYPSWYYKNGYKNKTFALFILYSVLNTGLFVPYINFFILLPYVIVDLMVHKQIYDNL